MIHGRAAAPRRRTGRGRWLGRGLREGGGGLDGLDGLDGLRERLPGGGGEVQRRLVALVGFFGHAAGNDFVERGWHLRSTRAGLRRVHRQVADGLLLHGVARKGVLTGEALVQHARQRIDVGTGVGNSGAEALRCHVGEGADDGAGAVQLGRRRAVGNPEIGQTNNALRGHQRVGRFDVAMHQSSGMRRVQRGR